MLKKTILNRAHIPVRSFARDFSRGIAVLNISSDTQQADNEVHHSHRHDYHTFVLQKKGISHPEIDVEKYPIKPPTITDYKIL